MIRDSLAIVNKLGLHARAASKFVACASQFACSIRLCKEQEWVDGKSIMAVMMLAAGKGTTLAIELDGPDAEEALAALKALVQDRFGEGE
ncbi:MAG: HPr family phosphocarrier protein [Pseudomonadota bacterium]